VIKWVLAQKFNKADYRGTESDKWAWVVNRWAAERTYYTLFFSDPEIFDHIKSTIGEQYLVEYEKPLDSQHSEMLEKEKVITRKKLFYDKYRFAVRAKLKTQRGQYDSSHINKMNLWCQEYFEGREGDYRANTDWNASFFFLNANDAMMFKLSNSDFSSTERIVLISELEEARREPAA
jgi:hypothetical protein